MNRAIFRQPNEPLNPFKEPLNTVRPQPAEHPVLKKYILTLCPAAGLARRHGVDVNETDPLARAQVFIEMLNGAFSDKIASASLLPPCSQGRPRVEVECLAAAIGQIRFYFTPVVSEIAEAKTESVNDNAGKFWKRLKPFLPANS